MGSQKKMYTRWLGITEKTKQVNECKAVMNTFNAIAFTIKNISDNAFLQNRENFLKEQALLRLFRNMQQNMDDCFRKWRDCNRL